jgi:hypothetical protein
VKGGEGNSVTITERPPWAQEFLLWCHSDGSIVNQPSQGVHSIVVNRLANDLMRRGKAALPTGSPRQNAPLRKKRAAGY